jgi:transposase
VDGVLQMSAKERERTRVIEAVIERRLTQAAAATRLGLCVRQVKRLCRAYRRRGAAGLVSRKRGHPSNRRIAAVEQRRVLKLLRAHYADFGPTLAAEYLSERHRYAYSAETLRQWMITAGLWQPQRGARRRVHPLRERRRCIGELVQIDGSPHAWLEARGPRCCLIIFVDDATSRVQYARFEPVETSRAYLDALEVYVQSYGRPLAFYSDRHSIFTKHDPEDPAPTQVERAVRALDIEPILAWTPQAKGRVERAFQTLQDRLVKALRLAAIDSLAAANDFLPGFLARYNARFAHAPVDGTDAHRPLAMSAEHLHWSCCEQFPRTLSRALSCQYRGRLYVINTAGAAAYQLRQARITICDPGHAQPVMLLYAQRLLPYRSFDKVQLAPARVADDKTVNQLVDAAKHKLSSAHHQAPPPPHHPWRRRFKPPRPALKAPR